MTENHLPRNSGTIVVGYNGSDSASEAVTWAAHEATIRNVPLRMVSCFELPVGVADASLGWGVRTAYDAIRESATAGVEAISTKLTADFPDLSFSTEVPPGPAATALLSAVEPDDLVVVGSSGHHGATAFWLGTTPRQLIHNSPCPVVVVRGAVSHGRPDRVVVGVDSTDSSDRAVQWAADEADLHGVELVLVHGWKYPYGLTTSEATRASEITQIDADTVLNRSVDIARQRCGSTVTAMLVEAYGASAVIDSVCDGDVLVLGSRGRGGLKTRLFGSTVNSVLETSAVPVVVVRSDMVATSKPGLPNREH